MARISRTLIATSLLYLVAGAPASDAATLWIADETANMIYEVTLEGSLITSFPQVRGGDSCIDVDFTTDTLWSTAESKDRAVNFSKAGELPPACAACVPEIDLGALGAEGPEGVGVALADDTLWVVDDPVDSAVTPQVFHVALDGTLLSSFFVSSFEPLPSSPQAIAVDPADGTLWLTDNQTDLIYHITQAGALIGSFSVLTYTGVSDPEVHDPNPQGITVDRSNGTLWVTDRATSKIYNVTSGRHGEPGGDLLFSFDSTTYDASSLNPTGVAYDGPVGEPKQPYWVWDFTDIPFGPVPLGLSDQFNNNLSVSVDSCDYLMNPVTKSPSKGILDPDLHYSWNRIDPPPKPGATQVRNVRVSDQFGVNVWTIRRKPTYVLAPTAKCLGLGCLPGPVPPNQHYACYEAVKSPFIGEVVNLEDQFQPGDVNTVGMGRWVCTPVEKNGSEIFDDLHLACYDVPLTFNPAIWEAEDQFGTFNNAIGQTDAFLCVPAEKELTVGQVPTMGPWGLVTLAGLMG
ncbi:MAG: hypothetical protein V3T08_08500, partial [Gemmatimonadota bacterium]